MNTSYNIIDALRPGGQVNKIAWDNIATVSRYWYTLSPIDNKAHAVDVSV
ncbi:hypothetical protein SAMN05444410_10696 [Hydrobacter penzbergensis]|uniref:Uncharacterized protein n=1 Tax=Hydrobacter penzbergensis TaxID=1235997 RepID=A0A8X8IC47_9BACT|nr:hypothetical protein SAMN05444410_10696 [Hydrobacter penzbergensis]